MMDKDEKCLPMLEYEVIAWSFGLFGLFNFDGILSQQLIKVQVKGSVPSRTHQRLLPSVRMSFIKLHVENQCYFVLMLG